MCCQRSQTLIIRDLHLTVQDYLEYLSSIVLGRKKGTPQAAAVQDEAEPRSSEFQVAEIQQICHLAASYDCQSPTDDSRIADLHFWMMMTAVASFEVGNDTIL